MLLLGVPFHVSEIYRLSGGALVESPERSFTATLLGCVVHVFRMPAFFLLAGFFASMLLARTTGREWLADRCLRLGVPLVFTTLAFGWLEVSMARAHREGIELSRAVLLTWQTDPFGWTHHRWFLFVLLLYCLTAVVVRRYAAGSGAFARGSARCLVSSTQGKRGTLLFALALIALPFGIAGVGGLSGSAGVGLDGEPAYENFYLHYAVFFGYGYALQHLDGSIDRLIAFSFTERLLAGLSIAVYVLTYDRFYTGTALSSGGTWGTILQLVRIGVALIAGFYASRLFFLGARRYLDVRGPIIARLVEGSLCIYLVHEVFVLGFGIGFATLSFPPMIEFTLIVIATLAASIGTFELVRRSRWLSLLVNGRRLGKPRDARESGGMT